MSSVCSRLTAKTREWETKSRTCTQSLVIDASLRPTVIFFSAHPPFLGKYFFFLSRMQTSHRSLSVTAGLRSACVLVLSAQVSPVLFSLVLTQSHSTPLPPLPPSPPAPTPRLQIPLSTAPPSAARTTFATAETECVGRISSGIC